jgi:hypothetical protein
MEEIPMKRIAFAAAAALLGTGCIATTTTPQPTGGVNFSWSFLRWKATDSSFATYSCAQARVDNVVVSFPSGDVVVPCTDGGGDGAYVTAPPGTQTVVLTGRRGGVDLFTEQVTLTISENQTTDAPVQLTGIASNLSVYAHFLDRYGSAVVNWNTCTGAGVSDLDWRIVDSNGTTVASAIASACSDPAGVSFLGAGALDRDTYTIRMQGYPAASAVETFDSATTAVTPVCDGQAFDHFGQAATDRWDVDLYDVTHNTTGC